MIPLFRTGNFPSRPNRCTYLTYRGYIECVAQCFRMEATDQGTRAVFQAKWPVSRVLNPWELIVFWLIDPFIRLNNWMI